ncbi:MAG: hypothetical protein HYV37_03775 [Candidatus Levyibacteriota bacterium]|nr:MAG: hypothetical protein HYV37_03775 [Candidatus Levybacteria bacterium]
MNITSTIEKLKDNTIKLTITIPSNMVKKTWEKVVEETSKNAKVSGFRKGKAPKKLIEEQIDTEKIREEVLKELLPQAYIETVKKHNITPIVNPKIHVEKFEEGGDWEFTALTCETPEVNLGKYKDEIQKITAKSKIIIPGKEPQQPNFDEIVKTLLAATTAIIPSMLIEHEVDRLLSQTLDEVKRLGMTLEQYLNATKRTPQNLREEYQKKAETDIKLEFVLQKIAEAEKIVVEEKEIQEAIQKAKDETERKNLEANKYLLASILRQQKTLDFLRNL